MLTTVKRLASSVLAPVTGKARLFVDSTTTPPQLAVRDADGSLLEFPSGGGGGGGGLPPFSASVIAAGTTDDIVPDVTNLYESSPTVYPTELDLPASPTANMEVWVRDVATASGVTTVSAGSNTIEINGGAGTSPVSTISLDGHGRTTVFKWDNLNSVWRVVLAVPSTVYWSGEALIGPGNFLLHLGVVNDYADNADSLTLQFPQAEHGAELWLKERAMSGEFPVSIQSLFGVNIEHPDGSLSGSSIISAGQAGLGLHYKYDAAFPAWRIVSSHKSNRGWNPSIASTGTVIMTTAGVNKFTTASGNVTLEFPIGVHDGDIIEAVQIAFDPDNSVTFDATDSGRTVEAPDGTTGSSFNPSVTQRFYARWKYDDFDFLWRLLDYRVLGFG